jgi:hypothetical protein
VLRDLGFRVYDGGFRVQKLESGVQRWGVGTGCRD